MSEDSILREEIRCSLSEVRQLIRSYSGLYTGEDLARDVLQACDGMAPSVQPSLRFKEVRRLVQERCAELARDADRFTMRDPGRIAASRARAVASIDLLQDVVLELRRAEMRERGIPRPGCFLKRRSL